MIKDLIALINIIRLWPHLILFSFNPIAKTEFPNNANSIVYRFLYRMVFDKYYRTVFYHRIGNARYFIEWLAPSPETFIIDRHCKIGSHFIPGHCFATVINAVSIGENFTVFQNTTVGENKGKPTIGNNVSIFSNCVVVGDITIGNNVEIGAGSIVLKSVPDNCVVVGNPAKIIRLNGEKVNIPL